MIIRSFKNPCRMVTVMLMKYLIICPLVFLAGYIDAIAGGGGLISLPAYLMAGLPTHNAIATNKVSSCMGTAVATIRYGLNGYIPIRESLVALPCALMGSYLGTRIALMIDSTVFSIVLLAVLPLTAAYILFGKHVFPEAEPETVPLCRLLPLVILIAFTVGVYDGFYGPGTGTFLMLLLTSVAKMPLNRAAGLTKVINLSTNVAALVSYLIAGKALLLYGIPAGLFSVLGNYLGAKSFSSRGTRIVKPAMIAVITLFIIKTVYELLT